MKFVYRNAASNCKCRTNVNFADIAWHMRKSTSNAYLFPLKTSGLQYSIVPQNVEKTMSRPKYAADPKSISLHEKCWSMITFSSFTSRCTMFLEWRYATALTTWNRPLKIRKPTIFCNKNTTLGRLGYAWCILSHLSGVCQLLRNQIKGAASWVCMCVFSVYVSPDLRPGNNPLRANLNIK